MKNPLELLQFGKEISENYVRDNKPLTESLVKLAQTHSLNKQEMYRVAETANIETYLQMINKSEDKYVEFPLADANEAYSTVMAKTASITAEDNDYTEYADIGPRVEFSFNLYNKKGEDVIKTASVEVNTVELIQQADRLNGVLDYIGNSLMEETVQLASEYDQIYSTVKQAMLRDEIPFVEVKELIKIASPMNCENLIEALTTDLKKILPIYDFTKEASISGEINKTSDIYQAILNYDLRLAYITKVAEAFNEYEVTFDKVNNENKLGIAKKAGVLNAIKKTLKIGAGLTLAGAGGTLAIGAKIAKDREAAGQILNKASAQQSMMNAKLTR